MSGRPKIFNDKQVIEKATELFWSKGYEATSTEQLLAAMGIGKGSFYLAFKGGKKELFEKVLEQFNQQGLDQLKKVLAESSDPIESIRNFFRAIADSTQEVHFKGCLMGNTIAELSNIDPQLQAKATHMLTQLEHAFYETIRTAQEKGNLKTKEAPALLARHLVTAWNGLNITRRMYTDAKALKPLIEMQLQILT